MYVSRQAGPCGSLPRNQFAYDKCSVRGHRCSRPGDRTQLGARSMAHRIKREASGLIEQWHAYAAAKPEPDSRDNNWTIVGDVYQIGVRITKQLMDADLLLSTAFRNAAADECAVVAVTAARQIINRLRRPLLRARRRHTAFAPYLEARSAAQAGFKYVSARLHSAIYRHLGVSLHKMHPPVRALPRVSRPSSAL